MFIFRDFTINKYRTILKIALLLCHMSDVWQFFKWGMFYLLKGEWWKLQINWLRKRTQYSFHYIKNIERLSFMGMQILYTINSWIIVQLHNSIIVLLTNHYINPPEFCAAGLWKHCHSTLNVVLQLLSLVWLFAIP